MRFRNLKRGQYRLIVAFKEHNLASGVYFPSVAVRRAKSLELILKILRFPSFIIEGKAVSLGVINLKAKWNLKKVNSD